MNICHVRFFALSRHLVIFFTPTRPFYSNITNTNPLSFFFFITAFMVFEHFKKKPHQVFLFLEGSCVGRLDESSSQENHLT